MGLVFFFGNQMHQMTYHVLSARLAGCRGISCACDCPSHCSSRGLHWQSPSHCVASMHRRPFASHRAEMGWAIESLVWTKCSSRRREANRPCNACAWNPYCLIMCRNGSKRDYGMWNRDWRVCGCASVEEESTGDEMGREVVMMQMAGLGASRVSCATATRG